MKETSAYTVIFDGSGRRIMYLKDDGILSFVEETRKKDSDNYTECIVRLQAITSELENPVLTDSSFTGRMAVLFGNYDGLDRFHQFCDDRGIETMTLTWE